MNCVPMIIIDARWQIEAAPDEQRKCGHQPAHQSLLNRRLKALSPAPRNCINLPYPGNSAGTGKVRPKRLTTNIREFMRDNWLWNGVFASYEDIVQHCCQAWTKLVGQPWTIMSLGLREWAHRC
jgi:hypothetical protein